MTKFLLRLQKGGNRLKNKTAVFRTDLVYGIKNALYLLPINIYSHYNHLRDVNYLHERDKHPVRFKHFGKEGWKQEHQGEVTYRDYESYDEYVTHQQQKFDEILKLNGGFTRRTLLEFRRRFYSRFKHLRDLLPYEALIVCAGARQGTEVEVLRDLGFKKAYGIDLNPGPNNPFVRQGDFMHMDNPTSSLDLVYTNCIDHAFNLEAFFAEHARVIKPRGYVLYDIGMQSQTGAGPFESVRWESEEDIFLLMLRYFESVMKVESEGAWKWILLRGKREPIAHH